MFRHILDELIIQDISAFSATCRWIREACMPLLFRCCCYTVVQACQRRTYQHVDMVRVRGASLHRFPLCRKGRHWRGQPLLTVPVRA